jgi:hypothetical protein
VLSDVLFWNVFNQNEAVSNEHVQGVAEYLTQSVQQEDYYKFVSRLINNTLIVN